MSQYSEMTSALGRSDYIDFRSDTVTKPCTNMKQAAMDSPLGDDVYGEDPSVLKLEARAADLLKKEAALFFPTGTMSNLAALLSHCRRGEEVIIGNQYHIYRDEARGASVLGGIAFEPLSTDHFGAIKLDDVLGAIKPDDNHCAVSKLLSLENTVAGCIQNQKDIDTIAIAAKDNGLKVHLDGARLFNAARAKDANIADMVKYMDSVSICLSKGVGAPAGSLLIGTKELINYASRQRKLLGGGMRQSGIIAACGLYGIDHNVPRLINDHMKTKYLAEALSKIRQLGINMELVQTNMLVLNTDQQDTNAIRSYLNERGILIGGQSAPRMVIHLDISEDDIERTISAFNAFYKSRP